MAGEKLADLPADRPRHRPYRGQGSGVPLRALPRRRSGAVAGNEVHRRSHGNRSAISPRPSPSRSSARATICPHGGTVFVSVKDSDKPHDPASRCAASSSMGFTIVATGGTADYPAEPAASPVERVNKVAQGRPHIVDRIKDGEVALIFNTTEGWQSLRIRQSIRASALTARFPISPRRRPAWPRRRRSRRSRAPALKYGRCKPIIRTRTN